MLEQKEQLTRPEMHPSQFVSEYELIQNTPLEAEKIESYADEALDKITDLIQRAVRSFTAISNEDFDSLNELEDAACSFFSLEDVDLMLDHITFRSIQIRHLDSTIAEANETDLVIIPPTSAPEIPETGETKFIQNRVLPKLKTVLFVLHNDFGIDVDDPLQITLLKGNVSPDMMRKNPYYMVYIPSLSRTVYVCDESGNITYVLNDEKLKEHNIDGADIQTFNKDEIDDLLELDRTIGQRVKFSKNFVLSLIKAIREPGVDNDEKEDKNLGKYLIKPASDGILSIGGIQKVLDIATHSVVKRAVEKLDEKLGEVRQYRFGNRIVNGYTPAQQELILDHLIETGYFNIAPEDHKNVFNMAQEWGIAHNAVKSAIDLITEELGEVTLFRFKAGTTEFYSPDQQESIRQKVEERGLFNLEAPKGYLSVMGIAKVLHLDHKTVASAIEALEGELGNTSIYKFHGQPASAYSSDQRATIKKYLVDKGIMVDVAPKDVVSVQEFARMLGLSTANTVERAIEGLEKSIGKIDNYRFGERRRPGRGLNAQQQQQIKTFLTDDGTIAEVPEGYVGMVDLVDQFDTTYALVRKAIKKLTNAGQMGEVRQYRKTSGRTTSHPHFSPEQQAMISEFLQTNGYINNDAPEGYVPNAAIAKEMRVAHNSVGRAVIALGDSLGEVKKYKFRTYVTAGFSPEQQAMIKDYLKSRQ